MGIPVFFFGFIKFPIFLQQLQKTLQTASPSLSLFLTKASGKASWDFTMNDLYLLASFEDSSNLWQKNCIIKIKLKGENEVTTIATGKEKKIGMTCNRCGGRMIFEKFYDVNNVFFGWHCVICGEILDAVILLHRLSQDADLQIPEEEHEVMHLLKKYLNSKPKELKGGRKGKRGDVELPFKGKISLN
jgi:hypothetical protein